MPRSKNKNSSTQSGSFGKSAVEECDNKAMTGSQLLHTIKLGVDQYGKAWGNFRTHDTT
jgi:hypothetical protein